MYARAGEPKKLVVLKGFGHYEVYGGGAFRQVMVETMTFRFPRCNAASACVSSRCFDVRYGC
jgi:hypothetical protein